MKNTLFIITTVIIFAICASDVLSIQNNGIRNPAIEYTTRPPSSYENSTYQSPNPIGTNGNSIVTGNVRQGARFQGEVPYRSTSSFSSANLGTSTLSSFMRDSSGSEDFGRYQSSNTPIAGSYQPYQLRSETVATMSHDGTGITNQLNTRIERETQRISTLQTSTNQQMPETSTNSIESPASRQTYYPGTSLLQNQYNNSSELRRISPRALRKESQGQQNDQLSTAQNINDQYKYTDPSQRTIDTIQNLPNDSEIDGTLQAKINSELLRYNPGYAPDRTSVSLQYPATTQLPYDESREKTTFVNPNPRGYEIAATSEFYSLDQDESRRKASLGGPAARYPVNDITSRSGTATSSIRRNPAQEAVQEYLQQREYNQFSTENINIQSVDSEVLRQIKSQLNDLTQSIDARLHSEQYDAGKIGQTVSSEIPTTQKFRDSSLDTRDLSNETRATNNTSTRAKNVIESYPDQKSYTQAKFNEYYLAGERYLKAGRYYEAADSFTLAAIYKPDNSFCFAGQGHALFAAGQYISSALFLIRAVELDPECIQTDINLEEITGGSDRLESKTNELQQLLKKDPAAGLQFLLGYVYFRTGRLIEAKQITDSIYKEMSKSQAALALKMAVDLKLRNQ